MATYVIYGYSTDSLSFDSGSQTFTLDPDFDYQTDRIRVEITDDDAFFDGDNANSPMQEEIGDDANQTATISLPDGTVLASGPIYIEGYYDVSSGGSTQWVDELEIAGDLWGYFSTFDMSPGQTYSTTGYTDMLDGEELDYLQYTSVLCFGVDCPIKTPWGVVPAHSLRVGDYVETRDAGPLPIAARLDLPADAEDSQPAIQIARGALGNGLPRSTIVVSWQHRVMIRWGLAAILFGEDEVLVPAGGLTDMPGVTTVSGQQAFVHLAVLPHHLLNSAGLWSESLLCADMLRSRPTWRNRLLLYASANTVATRKCLTVTETRVLVAAHGQSLRKKRVA